MLAIKSMLSEYEYNEMLKAKKNADYLAMIDKSMAEAEAGGFITKSIEELERYHYEDQHLKTVLIFFDFLRGHFSKGKSVNQKKIEHIDFQYLYVLTRLMDLNLIDVIGYAGCLTLPLLQLWGVSSKSTKQKTKCVLYATICMGASKTVSGSPFAKIFIF